jgi:hypothetical protein
MKKLSDKEFQPFLVNLKLKLFISVIFLHITCFSFGQSTLSWEGYGTEFLQPVCHKTSSIDVAGYYYSNATDVGYYKPDANNYENFVYRMAYRFDFTEVPSYATISSATLSLYTGNPVGGTITGGLYFTKIRQDWASQTAETVYKLIPQGDALGSMLSLTKYDNYSITTIPLKNAVSTQFVSGISYLGLGVYNSLETSGCTNITYPPMLVITYTIPTPAKVTGLMPCNITATSFEVTWSPSVESAIAKPATGYYVYLNGSLYKTTTSTNMSFSGLCQGTTYNIDIYPFNSYGHGDRTSISATTLSFFLSGSANICSSSSETYTVTNLTPDCTITWSQSTNLNSPTLSGNSATFSPNGTGNAWVKATISSSTCSSIILQKTLWIGKPVAPTITGASTVQANQTITCTVNTSGATSYTWSKTGSCIVLAPGETDDTQTEVTGIMIGTAKLYVTVSNGCGSIASPSKTITVTRASNTVALKDEVTEGKGMLNSISIFPNPTSNELRVCITQSEKETGEESSSDSYIVNIINMNGSQVYSSKEVDSQFIVPTSGLEDGSYILTVRKGTIQYKKMFIVKHK